MAIARPEESIIEYLAIKSDNDSDDPNNPKHCADTISIKKT